MVEKLWNPIVSSKQLLSSLKIKNLFPTIIFYHLWVHCRNNFTHLTPIIYSVSALCFVLLENYHVKFHSTESSHLKRTT